MSLTTYKASENVTITVGGDTVCVKTLEIDEKITLSDTTTTCSGGFREVQPVLQQATVTFTYPLDSVTPFSYANGSTVDIVVTGDVAATLTVVVSDAKISVNVPEVVMATVTGETSGSYTLS